MSASVQDFHSQIASIMEVLANAAVAEICKVVDDGYAVVNLEMSRSHKENEFLRRRIKVLELQISRYRAERLKSPAEGSFCSRYPGVRLLQHRQGRDTPTGSGLQNRTRFLNRTPQRTSPIILDQDPDQEVVTTTKAEPIESEEDSDLVIVKVEGSMNINDNTTSNNLRAAMQAPPTEVSATSKTHGRNQTPTHSDKAPQAAKDPIVVVLDLGKKNSLDEQNQNEEQREKRWLPLQTSPGTSSGTMTSFINKNVKTVDQRATNVLPNVTNPSQNLQSSSSGQTSDSNFHFYEPVEQTFGCSSCPKRFYSEQELNQHTLRHAVHKRYPCLICGKGFVCKSQLDVHAYVHTGERPFPCPLCHKRFSHPSNLRRHQKLLH